MRAMISIASRCRGSAVTIDSSDSSHDSAARGSAARIATASRAWTADRDHRYRPVGVRPPSAAACSRQRTACSDEACQKFESTVPPAAPDARALARNSAIWGFSHPRMGDHRVEERMPGASRCGSKTATGPIASRARRVAVRLSGRVLVVITAPGASRIDGITRCRPLPERGGPRRTIESSTEQKQSSRRARPRRQPTSLGCGFCRLGRRLSARCSSQRRPAARLTSAPDATPKIVPGSLFCVALERLLRTHSQVGSPSPTARTTPVQVQYDHGSARCRPHASDGFPRWANARNGLVTENGGQAVRPIVAARSDPSHSSIQGYPTDRTRTARPGVPSQK